MTTFQSAEVVKTAEGRQYHIGVGPGEIAPMILLCGDPKRAYRTAEYFTKPATPITHREYVTITGTYAGIPITVMATGMGPDNTEIAIVEVSQIIPRPTFIRIGTSGGLHNDVRIGDQIVSSGALRYESTSTFFVPEQFPALAHHEVMLALLEAAARKKIPHHLGLTATAAGFYGAQGRHVPGFPPREQGLIDDLIRVGVWNFEMEASCLFSLATLSGARAGCVCGVINERQRNVFATTEQIEATERNTIELGLEAVVVLSHMDARRQDARYWLPSMGM